MKKLLLLSIALIGSIATAQGKPSAAKSASDWEKIKLGAKIGRNAATCRLDKQRAEQLRKQDVKEKL